MTAGQRRSTDGQRRHESKPLPLRRVAVTALVVVLTSALLIAAGGAATASRGTSTADAAASPEISTADAAASPEMSTADVAASDEAMLTDHGDEEAVIVSLEADGDARLAITVTFDLTDADEESSFEELREATDRQQRLLTRYEQRVTNVAAEMENVSGREMTVTAPQVDTRTADDGSVGVVELSVTWDGLAASEGDRLRLTAPFDSGFAPDRQLVVDAPDGYRVAETSPEPAVADDRLVWDSDQSLDGFVLSVESGNGNETTDDEQAGDDGAADDSGPGFGIVAALLALGGLSEARRRS